MTEKKEKDEKDKGKDKDNNKDSKKSKKDAAKAKDKDNKEKKEPAKQSADSGRVVSLMASDANRVGMTISGFYFIVSGVLEVPVACAFLYSLLGYSAFVGFLSMVVASPLNSYFMKRYFKVSSDAFHFASAGVRSLTADRRAWDRSLKKSPRLAMLESRS